MRKKKLVSTDSFDAVQSISMQTLDKELSRHVEVARTKPVAIDRYGVPWVWIVSHPVWMQADYLKTFVPPEHALVALREAVDSALAYETPFMAELTPRCRSGLDAKVVLRAWLLQIVYSLVDPRRVHEALGYNMLWRWFVGYQLRSEPLPEEEAFVHDVHMLSAYPHVLDIVHRCLDHTGLTGEHAREFSINHGLLHTLQAHHLEVAVPAGEALTVPRRPERDTQTLHG